MSIAKSVSTNEISLPIVGLIISVKETRKLLGKDGKSLTDKQVEDLIITLTEASSLLLSQG